MAEPQKNLPAIKPLAEMYEPTQIQVLKSQICKDITDEELILFGYVSQRTGLDPFARQIYAVKRRDNKTGQSKMVVQTSIDGFRLIAFRTGVYAGREETSFEYDGDRLVRAKVTVYKMVEGIRCPFPGTAKWDEFFPGDTLGFMWRKMPEVMLGKCAEAQALRMAFPAELSGIYTETEMEQAVDSKADTIRKTVEQSLEREVIEEKVPLSQFKINFGKLSQYETLGKVPASELVSYVSDIEKAIAKSRRQPEGAQKDLLDAARAYLEESMTRPAGGGK